MNLFAQAIHNVTKHSPKLIEEVMAKTDRVRYPFFPVGTMQWDIWKMYQVLQEYEQLRQQRTNN